MGLGVDVVDWVVEGAEVLVVAVLALACVSGFGSGHSNTAVASTNATSRPIAEPRMTTRCASIGTRSSGFIFDAGIGSPK